MPAVTALPRVVAFAVCADMAYPPAKAFLDKRPASRRKAKIALTATDDNKCASDRLKLFELPTEANCHKGE